MDRLVHIVPDKAAAHVIVPLKGIHILFKISQAVLHTVGEFAQDDRLTAVHLLCDGFIIRSELISQIFEKTDFDLPLLAQGAQFVCRGIHPADKVGLGQIKIPFIVDGPTVIQFQDPLAHFHKVITVARLIAQGPESHTGMVAVAQHHTLRPVDHGLCPHGIAPGNTLAPHAVRLHIALIHHIEAQLVAQIIKIRIIRIVTGADRIDVGPLHQEQVLPDALVGDCPAVIRVKVVAVDALNL